MKQQIDEITIWWKNMLTKKYLIKTINGWNTGW